MLIIQPIYLFLLFRKTWHFFFKCIQSLYARALHTLMTDTFTSHLVYPYKIIFHSLLSLVHLTLSWKFKSSAQQALLLLHSSAVKPTHPSILSPSIDCFGILIYKLLAYTFFHYISIFNCSHDIHSKSSF